MATTLNDRVVGEGQVAGLDARFDDKRLDDKKRAAQVAAQKRTAELEQDRNGSGFATQPKFAGPAVRIESETKATHANAQGEGPALGDGRKALHALEALLATELPPLPNGQKPLQRFSTEGTALAAMAGKPLSSEAMAKFPVVSLLNVKLGDGEANLVMRSYGRVANRVMAGLAKGQGLSVTPTSKTLHPEATKALGQAFQPLISFATLALDKPATAHNSKDKDASEGSSEGSSPTEMSGAEGAGASATTSAKHTKGHKVPPIPPEVEQSIRDAAKGPLAVFAGDGPLDIDQLIELVMMECAVDAEKDLAKMAEEMNELATAKQAQRKLAQIYRESKTELDSQMRNEFNILKSQGKIAEGWTVEDYTKWRRVAVVPPEHNADGTLKVDKDGEPMMAKPQVAQPSPPKSLPPFFTKPKNPDPASAAGKKGRVPGDVGDDYGLMPEQVTKLQQWFTQFVWSNETVRQGLMNSTDPKAGFREWLEMTVGVTRAGDGNIDDVLANNKAISDWIDKVGTKGEENSISGANDAASKANLAYANKLLDKVKHEEAVMDAAKKAAIKKMMEADLQAVLKNPKDEAAIVRIGRVFFGKTTPPDVDGWRAKIITYLRDNTPEGQTYRDQYEQRARAYMASDGLSETNDGLGVGADMTDIKKATASFTDALKNTKKVLSQLFLNPTELTALNLRINGGDFAAVRFWMNESNNNGGLTEFTVAGAIFDNGLELGTKVGHYTGDPDQPFDPNKLTPVAGDYKSLLADLKNMQSKYKGEVATVDAQFSAYGLSQEQIQLVQYMFAQLGGTPSSFAQLVGLTKNDGSDPDIQKKNFDAITAFIDKNKAAKPDLYANILAMAEFAKNGPPDGKAFLLTPATMALVTKLWVQLGPDARKEYKDFSEFLTKGLKLDGSADANSAKNVDALYAFLGEHPGFDKVSVELSLLQHPFDANDFQFSSKSTFGPLFAKMWGSLTEAERAKYNHNVNEWAKKVVGLESRDPGGKNEKRVEDYCKQLDGTPQKAKNDLVREFDGVKYGFGASTAGGAGAPGLDAGGPATGNLSGALGVKEISTAQEVIKYSTWQNMFTRAKDGSLGEGSTGADDDYIKFLRSKGFLPAPSANQLGASASGIDPATGDNKTTGEHSQNAPGGMVGAELCTLDQLENLGQAAKDDLDSLSEMSEMKMMKLQLLMDRRAKLLEAVSNVMKKVASSADGIINNLKV